MGIFNLKPARDARVQDVDIISDLDAIVSKSVGFKFQGKTYVIEPLSTLQFAQLVKSFEEMDRLKKNKDGTTMQDWAKNYAQVFQIACPQITLKDVEQMTQGQVAALFQLILDCISGRQQAEDEKKKMTPTHHVVSPQSLA